MHYLGHMTPLVLEMQSLKVLWCLLSNYTNTVSACPQHSCVYVLRWPQTERKHVAVLSFSFLFFMYSYFPIQLEQREARLE